MPFYLILYNILQDQVLQYMWVLVYNLKFLILTFFIWLNVPRFKHFKIFIIHLKYE